MPRIRRGFRRLSPKLRATRLTTRTAAKSSTSLKAARRPNYSSFSVSDRGPGIRDLETILEGRYESQTGMGLGIIGARRLMDQFQIDSVPGKGTTIQMKKLFPKRAPVIRETDLARIADALGTRAPAGRLPGTAAPEPGIVAGARGDPHPPGRTELASIGNWKIPTAALSRFTLSWTKRPTICGAPTN